MILTIRDMKKIIVFILAVFAIISCQSASEEFLLKQMLSHKTTVSGVTGFEKHKTFTLADEVDAQLKLYNGKITWDKSFYDAFRENVEDSVYVNLPEKYVLDMYQFYKSQIKKDETIITYLESIDDIYPDRYNQVSFTIYKLTYTGIDESNNKVHTNCYGKFDKNGTIVAFKLSDTSKWEMIGNNCSIPDYVYYITSVFQDI